MTDASTGKENSGLGQRLKLRRQAKGWSLEELATEMGGLVTKQAIHKYENAQARPTPRVLQKLAQVLEVSALHLAQEPENTVAFVAYRKASGLSARDQEQIKARVEVETLERVRLQKLLGQELDLPALSPVESLEDAERAADELREKWDLGVDSICSLSTILEDHGVHIIEVEASEKFHGLSAHVQDRDNQNIAAAVIARRALPGDRWRLTNAHELGHLVLRFAPDAEEKWVEKAAFRFGAAFLAPRRLIEREVGTHRHRISLPELFLLKPRLGMSAQAIAYRLKDLGILSEDDGRAVFMEFARNGWRKEEPQPLESERPTWLQRSVYHALSEGLISARAARRFLGNEFDESAAAPPTTASRRLRALVRLPLEERRRILEEQSHSTGDVFSSDPQWKAWEALSDPIEWAADLENPAAGKKR